jgi:DNA-binding NtrC family response regulator
MLMSNDAKNSCSQSVKARERFESMALDYPVVMVVDDEAPVRTSIAALLDLEGYAVVEASDGEEAIRIMRRQPVDAVISDVRMPGHIDGIGLAGWMADNAPAILLLLISGKLQPNAIRRTLPETPFFQKPFRMGDMLAELGIRMAARHQIPRAPNNRLGP